MNIDVVVEYNDVDYETLVKRISEMIEKGYTLAMIHEELRKTYTISKRRISKIIAREKLALKRSRTPRTRTGRVEQWIRYL